MEVPEGELCSCMIGSGWSSSGGMTVSEIEVAREDRLQPGLMTLPQNGSKNGILQTEECPKNSKKANGNKGKTLVVTRY